MSASPLIVLLDGNDGHFRAALLKARGYRVLTTSHVVEVCLHWISGDCAGLVIGPQFHWPEVATLCQWIKMNSPQKIVILLSDRRNPRLPVHADAVIPAQPVQAFLQSLRALLPANGQGMPRMAAGLCHRALPEPFSRIQNC